MNSVAQMPDSTAVRTALWRALHLLVDSRPFVFEDDLALRIAAPEPTWRERADMDPKNTRGFRAGIVGRARFVENLLAEGGLSQYVLLGAGLDTFAYRHPHTPVQVFEIDQIATQKWKQARIEELGFPGATQVRFVPVDFEAGDSWSAKLDEHGFDRKKPALVASTGVSLYLTREAVAATLREAAALPSGSILAMTFYLPLDLVDPAERSLLEMVYSRARAAGTPFLSFFTPEEIKAMAFDAGFRKIEHVDRAGLISRLFSGRTDGLSPASGEEFSVART